MAPTKLYIIIITVFTTVIGYDIINWLRYRSFSELEIKNKRLKSTVNFSVFIISITLTIVSIAFHINFFNYTNMDTGGCAARTFTLTSALPSLMSTVFSQSVFTLTPGQTANAAMTKTVPAGFTPGTYSADSTVGDAAHSTTALANMTVQAPPQPIDVSVTATPSTIPVRAITAIRATVTNAFGIVAGASVTFRAVRSSGSATTKTVTSNTAGVAVWDFKPNQKDTYAVTATATFSGASATSVAITLTVN